MHSRRLARYNPDLVAVVYRTKDREIEWWNQQKDSGALRFPFLLRPAAVGLAAWGVKIKLLPVHHGAQ